MNVNNRVAIIGAGIGGLTAALALIRQGIGVDVYEQAPELKELGAGVQISSNGTRVLYALGLGAEAERLGVVVAGKEIRLWSTGQTWKLFDLGAVSVERYGFPYMMFHRGDLHAVLLDAIRRERPDAIHLDRKCVGLTQNADSVTIAFERGEAATAPLVIGADGVQSRVRLAVFGADRPEFTGIVAWRVLVPRDRVPNGIKLNVGTNWVGPGGHCVHYPVRGGALLNFVGLLERDDWRVESWTVQGSADEFCNDFRNWHPDIHATIRSGDTPYKWALFARPPMPSLDRRPRHAAGRRLPFDAANDGAGRGDGAGGRPRVRPLREEIRCRAGSLAALRGGAARARQQMRAGRDRKHQALPQPGDG